MWLATLINTGVLQEFSKDADGMIDEMEPEKEIRVLLTSEEQQRQQRVNITPLKRLRHSESDDDQDDLKDWLIALDSETGNTYILHLVH